MVLKIFKSNSDGLTEIKENSEDKLFDYEKHIQTLIEKNIDTIFPELEFVQTEFTLLELRIDSVCFNNETNSFTIIEYKNVKHGGVIDQGMAYLDLLEKNREAFILLYQKQKGKLLEDVNWEETKVIVISPEFTPHQLRASFRTNDPIELWNIRRFNDETITLEKIHDKEKQIRRKLVKHESITLTDDLEENYLSGKYVAPIIPEETKKLFFNLKESILNKFSELESKQRKQYLGFYLIENGRAVCTIEAQAKQLRLDYCTSRKDVLPEIEFIRYMRHPDGKRIGHFGTGDYESIIRNDDDIEKTLPLIEKIYELNKN